MNREELIKELDKQQLEILLNDLQDIDKFTGFKDGAFKYELEKYQANLLVNCIKKQKEVIDKLRNNLEKDISVIKNVKMSNKEIICRLEETNKILKEVE